MFKKLFRFFAGWQTQPEIVFTCRGIYSELVINITPENAEAYRAMTCLFPLDVTKTGRKRWRLSTSIVYAVTNY